LNAKHSAVWLLNESISQILAAGIGLARPDFCRLNRSAFGTAHVTNHWAILRWLNPSISPETIVHIQFFVRKAGHVTEYAILAALLWRALRGGTVWRMKMSMLFVLVWIGCALFAASDEFHQSFVPSRTASGNDVIIDICGALIGLTICIAVGSRKVLKESRA
jgi:VanZ family protein